MKRNYHTKKEIEAMCPTELMEALMTYNIAYYNDGGKATQQCLRWCIAETLFVAGLESSDAGRTADMLIQGYKR